MASFDINAVNRRVQFTTNGSQTDFAFSFQINTASDLKVILGTTTQTLSSDYSVTVASDGTGTVTFSSAPTTGQKLTILANKSLSRTSVYSTGASFSAQSLETDFDDQMMFLQQLNEKIDRSPKLAESVIGTTSPSLTIPYDDTASNNANKVIAFDSTGTQLQLSDSGISSVTVNVTTLSAGSSGSGTGSVSGDALTLNLSLPQGADGTSGSDGADGNDGIFNAIASQSEAEAGTNNDKGMTPLRVKQAVDSQVGSISAIASKFFGLKKTTDSTGRTIATQEHTLVGGSEALVLADYDTYFFATGSIFMSINSSGHLIINMP